MESRVELAKVYLDKRPGAAAHVLETLSPPETTALLQELPARICGPVLAAMHSHYAARCLTLLTTEYLVNVVQHLSSQRAASLLRVLAPAQQDALLHRLSAHHARTLRFLLSYSGNLVGAWTDPNAVTISPGVSVGETRQRLQQLETGGIQRLFLVDAEHQLKGSVFMAALFQAQDEMAIERLADTAPLSLRARTSLTVAEQHNGWIQFIEMPVIGRAKEFIGVVTYQNIHRSLQELRRRPAEMPGKNDEMINGLSEVLRAGVHGAWVTWMELLSIPVEDKGVNHEHESGYHRGA
ncbi:MAG: hypothetical protein GC149_14830 [Gammaproteobacteria bacterium]|nr:hypothetical protein [Gammaproteobacteria bacterium]